MKQFTYLQEESNRILSKVQKSFWSCTHVNSCTLYINLHILLNTLCKATSNIQESRKFIQSLKRYQDFIKRSKSLCLVFTEIVQDKITLHINLHILLLFIIYIKTSSNIPESSKSMKDIKSYQENMIEILEKFYFISSSFEFQVGIRLSGETMTQPSCQSSENVNHVRI